MSDQGRIVVHRHKSKVLEGNPLGDPPERDLYVYLPPNHEPAHRYPCLLAAVGFTGTGSSLFNIDPLGEDLKRRLDRLITSGTCPPVIVAAPDCFTRLGGREIHHLQIGPHRSSRGFVDREVQLDGSEEGRRIDRRLCIEGVNPDRVKGLDNRTRPLDQPDEENAQHEGPDQQ